MTEEKIYYILGLIDSTVGSAREYTADDLRRRLEMVGASLRGNENEYKRLGKIDLARQIVLDAA